MASSAGSSIRIALDLVATGSGAASISTLIYALSSLLNVTAPAATAADQLSAALAKQEKAIQGVAEAEAAAAALVADAQAAALAKTDSAQAAYDAILVGSNTKLDAYTQSLLQEEQALQSVALAKTDLADAQAILSGDNALVGPASAYRNDVAYEQQMSANLSAAQSSATAATIQRQQAQEAYNVEQQRLEAVAAQQRVAAQAKLDATSLSGEQQVAAAQAAGQARIDAATAAAANAQLGVQEAQAGVQAEQAAASLGIYSAALVAAAADAAIFDLALKNIIDSASQLQFSSAQMDLALHGTQAQIDALNPAIIQWADNSLYTTSQVHNLVQALSEKGMDVSAILNGNGQAAINFGEATNSDAVPAANALGAALQIFSSQGLTATEAANLLTGAYYNGVPSAQELQTAMEDAGGQAVVMGVSMKDLLTTIDLLAQAGMPASSSALSLRYMLQTLADPTNKAATDMNYLGLTIVNRTSPAVRKLEADLYGAGVKAATAAATGFDGTSVGLNNMFKEAQKLGYIPLNETFNAWAISSGAMSSKLFDAKGNFKGLGEAINQILTTVQKKSHGNKELATVLIGDMFNVRSGRAAEILANMKDFAAKYNKVSGEIGNTSASKDASKLLDTLHGASQELKTTLTSLSASAGAPLLQFLTHLVQGINQFASSLMKNHPHLVQFMGIFIAIGAVLATVVAIILVVVVVFMVVAAVVGGPVLAAFGIVLIIIPIVAAIAALIIMNWGKLTKFFSGLAKDIGAFFSHLGAKFHEGVIYAELYAVMLWFEVQAKFHQGIEWVENAVKNGFNTVVGWFSWLYNHNYYFKKLVDFVKLHFMKLLVEAEVIWHKITAKIEQAWQSITRTVSNAINGVKTKLSEGWHNVVTGAQEAWKSFVSKITTNPVTTALGHIKDAFTHFMTNLATNATNWGRNLIQNLINGINDKLAGLSGTVSHVAGTIWKFLGFHSPTKEGPGSDADTWGPNLIRMYAQGITSSTPFLVTALSQAANLTRFALTQGMLPGGVLLGGNQAAIGGGGTQVVNVSVGSQPLFQLMMNHLTGQLQINGLGRMLN